MVEEIINFRGFYAGPLKPYDIKQLFSMGLGAFARSGKFGSGESGETLMQPAAAGRRRDRHWIM